MLNKNKKTGKRTDSESNLETEGISEFIPEKTRSQKRRFFRGESNRFIFLKVILVSLVGTAALSAAALGMVSLFKTATTHRAIEDITGSVQTISTGMAISEDDYALLEGNGCDPNAFMQHVRDFSGAYFNWDQGAVANGSWRDGLRQYIDEEAVWATPSTNELRIKMEDAYAESMANVEHVYGELREYLSIDWYFEYNIVFDREVPVCDIELVVVRPALLKYDVNSPDPEVNMYQDLYHYIFAPDGRIFSVRKVIGSVMETGTSSDARSTIDKSLANTEEFTLVTKNENENENKNENENLNENANVPEEEQPQPENENAENAEEPPAPEPEPEKPELEPDPEYPDENANENAESDTPEESENAEPAEDDANDNAAKE